MDIVPTQAEVDKHVSFKDNDITTDLNASYIIATKCDAQGNDSNYTADSKTEEKDRMAAREGRGRADRQSVFYWDKHNSEQEFIYHELISVHAAETLERAEALR